MFSTSLLVSAFWSPPFPPLFGTEPEYVVVTGVGDGGGGGESIFGIAVAVAVEPPVEPGLTTGVAIAVAEATALSLGV